MLRMEDGHDSDVLWMEEVMMRKDSDVLWMDGGHGGGHVLRREDCHVLRREDGHVLRMVMC